MGLTRIPANCSRLMSSSPRRTSGSYTLSVKPRRALTRKSFTSAASSAPAKWIGLCLAHKRFLLAGSSGTRSNHFKAQQQQQL